jgi:hypothetical protein
MRFSLPHATKLLMVLAVVLAAVAFAGPEGVAMPALVGLLVILGALAAGGFGHDRGRPPR